MTDKPVKLTKSTAQKLISDYRNRKGKRPHIRQASKQHDYTRQVAYVVIMSDWTKTDTPQNDDWEYTCDARVRNWNETSRYIDITSTHIKLRWTSNYDVDHKPPHIFNGQTVLATYSGSAWDYMDTTVIYWGMVTDGDGEVNAGEYHWNYCTVAPLNSNYVSTEFIDPENLISVNLAPNYIGDETHDYRFLKHSASMVFEGQTIAYTMGCDGTYVSLHSFHFPSIQRVVGIAQGKPSYGNSINPGTVTCKLSDGFGVATGADIQVYIPAHPSMATAIFEGTALELDIVNNRTPAVGTLTYPPHTEFWANSAPRDCPIGTVQMVLNPIGTTRPGWRDIDSGTRYIRTGYNNGITGGSNTYTPAHNSGTMPDHSTSSVQSGSGVTAVTSGSHTTNYSSITHSQMTIEPEYFGVCLIERFE